MILDCPEAHGVNVFATMEKHGISLEKHNPYNIIKIFFVGKIKIEKRIDKFLDDLDKFELESRNCKLVVGGKDE